MVDLDLCSLGVMVAQRTYTPFATDYRMVGIRIPQGVPNYSPLAQLDSSNCLLSNRSLVRAQHGLPKYPLPAYGVFVGSGAISSPILQDAETMDGLRLSSPRPLFCLTVNFVEAMI